MALNCSLTSPVPSVAPGGSEDFFCQMISTEYAALSNSIKIVASAPLVFVKRIKANIKRVEKVVASIIFSQLDAIELSIISMLKLNKFDKSKTRTDFCSLAFNCQVLYDVLQENVLFENVDITNYTNFEKYVCKKDIYALVSSVLDNQVIALKSALNVLSGKMESALKLDELEVQYLVVLNTKISDKTFFEWLAELDKYAQCAFSVCDYIESSNNLKEDYKAKLALDDTFTTVDLSKLTIKVDNLTIDINERIAYDILVLDGLKNGCGERTGVDEIANFDNTTIIKAKE